MRRPRWCARVSSGWFRRARLASCVVGRRAWGSGWLALAVARNWSRARESIKAWELLQERPRLLLAGRFPHHVFEQLKCYRIASEKPAMRLKRHLLSIGARENARCGSVGGHYAEGVDSFHDAEQAPGFQCSVFACIPSPAGIRVRVPARALIRPRVYAHVFVRAGGCGALHRLQGDKGAGGFPEAQCCGRVGEGFARRFAQGLFTHDAPEAHFVAREVRSECPPYGIGRSCIHVTVCRIFHTIPRTFSAFVLRRSIIARNERLMPRLRHFAQRRCKGVGWEIRHVHEWSEHGAVRADDCPD